MFKSRIFQSRTFNAHIFRGGSISSFGVLRYWDGSQWKKAKLKTYSAGSWQLKPMSCWNGASWISIDTSGI
jgi:hypothetical protein